MDQARQYGTNELTAILDSDVFVYLSNERGTTLHMEYGAALAKAALGHEIKIYVVGENNARSPWHFNTLVKRVGSVEEVFKDLGIE